MEEALTLPAFAKINLSLRVLGRRPDGYHEIRTIFQTVTLHDRLTFRPALGEEVRLACTDPTIPTGEENLVLKAAAALRSRYGLRRGAHIELEKIIPAGGGLGGGSADAATALVGLACLWGVSAGGGDLRGLAARLGADVPFFLTGGTALGTGTGTEIEPLTDAPAEHLVVVTPPVHVSTAEAYKSLNAPALTKVDSAASLSVSRATADFGGSLQWEAVNDFEPAVFKAHPEILRARERLAAAGARRAMLSGSGASVFGTFDDEAVASLAADSLTAEPGWRVFRCATLGRRLYAEAFGRCARLLG
ncbi:MAG TPA: 4-(cytidine 5'-diphospho)-2-C-methyl-D-erythritol kinase [Pyrinomonadaceae bacterium]|nr:4-(cytidine 5'-diphospho)-2-C-methyl-D-erythritol kinase [Pyrinomonadaceae bacterium]